MKINNTKDFIEYIRLRLGHPVIQVELTDKQIEVIIEDEIDRCVTPKDYYMQYCTPDSRDKCVKTASELLKTILNKYPGMMESFCKEYNQPTNTNQNHYVLSKEHPNILYIECGRLPRIKAEEYVRRVMTDIRKIAGNEYKICFLPRIG